MFYPNCIIKIFRLEFRQFWQYVQLDVQWNLKAAAGHIGCVRGAYSSFGMYVLYRYDSRSLGWIHVHSELDLIGIVST
jgi:hypothetical protein